MRDACFFGGFHGVLMLLYTTTRFPYDVGADEQQTIRAFEGFNESISVIEVGLANDDAARAEIREFFGVARGGDDLTRLRFQQKF